MHNIQIVSVCHWYIIAKKHLHWCKFAKYARFQYSQFSIHKKAGKKLTPMIFPQIQQGEPQQRTHRKECGTVITGSSSNLLMCIQIYWALDNYYHGCFRKWLVNLPSKARRTIQTSMRYQSYKTSSSKCYQMHTKRQMVRDIQNNAMIFQINYLMALYRGRYHKT